MARALIRQYGFAPHIEPDTLFWNAMARAVIPLIRQAVIEECAKVAEDYKRDDPETVRNINYRMAIARDIRSLKP